MGTLFEYDPSTGAAVAKVEFDSNTGNYPMGDLLFTGGKLVGMTEGGGSMQAGNIFEYDYVNDVITSIVDMNQAYEGAYPSGGITAAPNGMYYCIAERGGFDNMGVIYEIDPVAGTNGVSATFNNTNGGFADPYSSPGANPAEMCLASNGKLYGLTSSGGVNSEGALFEFDPGNNSLTLKESFDAATTGRSPGAGLMQASDGKLYGTTSFGGTNNKGTLFTYDITGNILSAVFQFDQTNGSNPDAILSELSPGRIYGVSRVGGLNNKGVIFIHDIAAGTTLKAADLSIASGSGSGTLFEATNGIFYLMLTKDGANNQGTFSSFDTTTNQLTKLADMPGPANMYNHLAGRLTEINGKLYALRSIAGDDYKGNLFEFNTATNTLTEKLDFACATGYRPMTSTLHQRNTASGSLVWPGDCNSDLVANNLDLLNIGLAYNDAGPIRAGASTSWTGQPATAWTNSFATTVNHKHADTNGDGNVNMNDTTAIGINFNQVHPLRISSPIALTAASTDITLIPSPAAVGPGGNIDFDIYLGFSAPLPDSLYGIAFTLELDPTLVDASQTSLSWSPSVLGTLGTDMIAFSNYNPATGIIEIALTRINHTNVINISGSLGKLHLRAAPGITQLTTLAVTPSTIQGTSAGEVELFFTSVSGNATIDPLLGIPSINNGNSVIVYPNPAQSQFHIKVDTGVPFSLVIHDIKGRKIFEKQELFTETTVLTETWSSGIYLAEIHYGDVIYHSRIAVK